MLFGITLTLENSGHPPWKKGMFYVGYFWLQGQAKGVALNYCVQKIKAGINYYHWQKIVPNTQGPSTPCYCYMHYIAVYCVGVFTGAAFKRLNFENKTCLQAEQDGHS